MQNSLTNWLYYINFSLHLVALFLGLCLLQLLLQGYIEMNCPIKELAWFSVAGFGLVLGGFIFGLTTTQSIWDDIYGTDT